MSCHEYYFWQHGADDRSLFRFPSFLFGEGGAQMLKPVSASIAISFLEMADLVAAVSASASDHDDRCYAILPAGKYAYHTCPDRQRYSITLKKRRYKATEHLLHHISGWLTERTTKPSKDYCCSRHGDKVSAVGTVIITNTKCYLNWQPSTKCALDESRKGILKKISRQLLAN